MHSVLIALAIVLRNKKTTNFQPNLNEQSVNAGVLARALLLSCWAGSWSYLLFGQSVILRLLRVENNNKCCRSDNYYVSKQATNEKYNNRSSFTTAQPHSSERMLLQIFIYRKSIDHVSHAILLFFLSKNEDKG